MKSKGYLKERYDLLPYNLGSGAGGIVQMIQRKKDGRKLALKVFKYKKQEALNLEISQRRAILNELQIHSQLKFPHIIEYIESVIEEDRPYLILEYCNFDLFDYLINFNLSLTQINKLFFQLLNAIQYLHGLNIAHRDLKIENLCLDNHFNLKVIDFGFAIHFKNNDGTERLSTGLCGSNPYVAPEILIETYYDASRSDIWSLGIIYICMVSKSFPWEIANLNNVNFCNYLNDPKLLLSFLPSPLATDIIISILNPTPSFRPSIKQVLEAPWLSGNNIPNWVVRYFN
ncbi:Pkinase-domain-containing protein [Neoconidiobolus thromboides FSU 785]|nr:Pkinase-domain-containing protein [Neoconidiobolus thromboides FSU 785]